MVNNKYNFDIVNNRLNTGSLKWDVMENELPLWVADMDFKTLPEVTETLTKKAESGIFGYAVVTDRWYDAYINWWKKRHDFTIEKQWLIFTTGIVPAISCIVKRMTNTGDNVVVQTPVYDIFFHSIENHGRHVLESRLVYDGQGYNIDFEDLEQKLSNPRTTLMILCNPHNPVGKIWTKDELEKIGHLCKKHHVIVVSDEIHCDLTMPGYEYIPFASVSEECKDNSITCISASKTFNLAGLQSAAVMIPNEGIFNIMERGLNSDEIAEPGVFAIDGVVAAFENGHEWVDELRQYIYNNKVIVEDFIKKNITGIKPVSQNCTYLLWLDCSDISDNVSELCSFIRKTTGLFLSDGSEYRGNGSKFIRMNIACPETTLQDALIRLKKAVELYKK